MSEAATTTDVQTSVPADSVQPTAQGTNGKMSFDERIRTDPDFALQTVKNFQTKLNQGTARLKPLEQLETVAKGTFGDVSEGVTQIIGLADKAYRIEQNPQWKQALEDMIAGKRVVPTDGNRSPRSI